MAKPLVKMVGLMLLGLLLATSLPGCVSPKITNFHLAASEITISPTNSPLQDDFKIYTTVISSTFGAQTVYMINEDTDISGLGPNLFKDESSSHISGPLADFQVQNSQSRSLRPIFAVNETRYILAHRADFYEKPTRENGLQCTWVRPACFNRAKFNAAYPQAGGIILLSAIGYDASKTQALVAAQMDIGQDSGMVDVILLARSGNTWIVQQRNQINWII